MTCTGCKRRPGARRGRSHVANGWFMWTRGAELRFHGVVLCPECRKKPTNTDAYGEVLPTAELERLAATTTTGEGRGG